MALQQAIADRAKLEVATRAAEAELLMAAETFGAALGRDFPFAAGVERTAR